MPASVLPPGTIVARQPRGMRTIHYHGRILEAYTTQDALGRRRIWYRVEVLNTTTVATWPGSHCTVLAPAPA